MQINAFFSKLSVRLYFCPSSRNCSILKLEINNNSYAHLIKVKTQCGPTVAHKCGA